MRTALIASVLSVLTLTTVCAHAQVAAQAAPAPSVHSMGYGAPITLSAAKKMAAAAMVEANRIGVPMVVCVTDPSGTLLYLERHDNAISAAVTVASEKANSAAIFKRPTKAFEDTIAAGGSGIRVLRLAGAIPVEGGLPIVVDGKLIGAIGVSGGTGAQDGQVAKAGVDVLS